MLEYGTRNWTNFARPLNQLPEEEVTTLIINWIPKALSKNEAVKVRLRADHKTYEVWFKKKQGSVYVKAIKEKKQNMELLYYWKPNETFNDVTLADIHRSMAVADKVAKKKQRLSALTN